MNDREMDYITSLEAFDQINDAFEELVDFFSRIYDLLYNEFYILEKEGVTNDEYFDYCMKRLKIYHKKIDRIVSRIGNINYKDFESYVECAAVEHNTMFGKKDIIVERIGTMFNYSEDDESYYDEDDEEYDQFDGPDERFDEHILNLHIDFIMHTSTLTNRYPRLLKHKYELSMIYPEIERELLYAGYDPANVLTVSDHQRAHLMKMDFTAYENESFEAYFECINETIKSLILLTEKVYFDEDRVRNMLDFISFTSKKLFIEDLKVLIDNYEPKFEEDKTGILYGDVSVFGVIMDILIENLAKKELEEEIKRNAESNKRINVKPENCDDNNKGSTFINGEKMSQLFDLVKQVINTSNLLTSLYGLEICEKNNTPEYMKLIEKLRLSVAKEKEIASKISFNDFEKEMARNLVEKNLILFSEINPSNTLEQLNSLFNSNLVADYNDYIRSRIADLLPNLYLTPNNIYSSSEVPEYIISYHQIETLKELEGIIPTSNERVPLIVAKYEIILASVRIMDFFIEYNGNVSDVRLLDDELSAYLLDVDMDEYEFDRSECLTRLSIEYFDRLNNSEKNLTPLEHARETIVKLFVSLAIDKLLPEHIKSLWSEEYLEYSEEAPVMKLEKRFYDTW